MRFNIDGTVAIAEDDVNFNILGIYPEHRLWKEKVQSFLDGDGVIEKHVMSEYEITREKLNKARIKNLTE